MLLFYLRIINHKILFLSILLKALYYNKVHLPISGCLYEVDLVGFDGLANLREVNYLIPNQMLSLGCILIVKHNADYISGCYNLLS